MYTNTVRVVDEPEGKKRMDGVAYTIHNELVPPRVGIPVRMLTRGTEEGRGARVLFDPVLSDKRSPSQTFGMKGYTKPPCRIEHIPKVDAITISEIRFFGSFEKWSLPSVGHEGVVHRTCCTEEISPNITLYGIEPLPIVASDYAISEMHDIINADDILKCERSSELEQSE
ncbi:hypothetical protein DFS33DRAFT_1434577 [Desarmillaria ectypa]|nr:hypothetical protein DFS33DRAFT_1434577 [Desarmillaria ectypa]